MLWQQLPEACSSKSCEAVESFKADGSQKYLVTLFAPNICGEDKHRLLKPPPKYLTDMISKNIASEFLYQI